MRECVLKSIAGIFLLFQPTRYEMKPFHFGDTICLEWIRTNGEKKKTNTRAKPLTLINADESSE